MLGFAVGCLKRAQIPGDKRHPEAPRYWKCRFIVRAGPARDGLARTNRTLPASLLIPEIPPLSI
jgi:hypothetical protein